VIAEAHRYCGKEVKRKLDAGPLDHETEFKCKVYENGKIAAGPEILKALFRNEKLQEEQNFIGNPFIYSSEAKL
jgi:hypothetical protein